MASRTVWVLTLIWLVMTLFALAFVLHFGRNAPWADEWEMVPGLVGDDPILPWLWNQHNEHRLPLPRLLFWTFFQVTHDFRAGMVAQVLLLSISAALLMKTASQLRGQPHLTDAFIPLGLLHWGHVENLVMGYQICFALTTTVVLAILAIAARMTHNTLKRDAIAIGGLLLLLESTGGSGLTYLPAIGLWLLMIAASFWKNASRATAGFLLAIVLAGTIYVGLYLIGYQKPLKHPLPTWGDPLRIAEVTAQISAMSMGGAAVWAWQLSALAVSCVSLTSLVRLLQEARTPEKHPGALAMIAVFLGVLTLTVAIAIGRSGFSSPYIGLWSRYALLTWPIQAIAYLTSLLSRRDAWLPWCLLMMALFALPFNMSFGWSWASSYAHEMDQLEADVRAGFSPDEVYERGRYLKDTERHDQIVLGIRRLKETQFHYFREANTR